MKAAELFVKSLEAAGVRDVFGVPGEENLALLEALRTSSIRFVTTRDEQSAVFMAATVGRLTGRVGVALSTLGPGATNLVTGVAYAQLGGMPLLVVTGQKPIKKSKQGKFQIIDVVGMMKPITKMAETIVSADRVPSAVYQAVRVAETERPGAVHLELPEDIAEEESDEPPIPWQKIRRPVPDEKSIAQALAGIEQARSPIIAIASGANRKLVRKQLRNFIEKTGIPFVTTQMGKGVEDETSELYIGTTALTGGDFVHKALAYADLILMIGHDIAEKPPVIAGAHQKVIHFNFSPADIDRVYQPTLEVVGDISHALWAMSERIVKQPHWDFVPFLHARDVLREDIASASALDSFPMRPERVVADLQRALPSDGILSLDNGMYKIWVARNFPAREQNTILLDNALATMGAGLPVGIASKFLFPEKKVVVLAGDGGIMNNIADLETAHRLGTDLVIVILNDSGYGMIKWKQEGMKLADFGLSFGNPDFVKLAESFCVVGHKIERTEDFQPLLEKSLQAGGIHVIEVPVDYSMNVEALGSSLQKKIATLDL